MVPFITLLFSPVIIVLIFTNYIIHVSQFSKVGDILITMIIIMKIDISSQSSNI